MKEFSSKRGTNLVYWQYLEKYQIPYAQNHSSRCTKWYHEVNEWLKQKIYPKFTLRDQKCVKIFKMKEFSLKRGSNLEYWQYLEKYQIPYSQNHSSHCTKWYHEVNEWLRQNICPKFTLRGQKGVKILKIKEFTLKRGSNLEYWQYIEKY